MFVKFLIYYTTIDMQNVCIFCVLAYISIVIVAVCFDYMLDFDDTILLVGCSSNSHVQQLMCALINDSLNIL